MHPDKLTAGLSNAERDRFEALGDFQREFAPSYTNGIAGVILGAIGIAGGIYGMIAPIHIIAESHFDLPFCVEGKQSWVSVGGMSFISVAFIVAGVGFLWWSVSTLRRRVFFCKHGFWTARGDTIEVFKWDDVASIQQIMTKEHLPIHLIGFLIPAKPSRKIIVGQHDAHTCSFSPNSVREFSALEGIIRNEATQRHIPWKVIQ